MTPSWDLPRDVAGLFAYPFMVQALRAGTVVAVLGGVVGWFMVLRRESFAGHTLAVVGFAGASGAVVVGLSPTVGSLGSGLLAALVLARLSASGGGGGGRTSGWGGGRSGGGGGGAVGGERAGGRGEQSAAIGTVQAAALATGFLASSLYGGSLSGASSLLFGTITGVSASQVRLLVVVAAGCLATLAVLGRPLLLVSVDPLLARARHVPVARVGTVFLAVLALAATATAQITGSLLVFAVLVAPAATAQRLTARPARGLAASVALALAVTWLGEAAAYYSPFPIGFWVTSLGFGAYLLAVAATSTWPSVSTMTAAVGRARCATAGRAHRASRADRADRAGRRLRGRR